MMLALSGAVQGHSVRTDCMLAAWDLVKRWSYEERLKLADLATKIGLEAPVGRASLRIWPPNWSKSR